MIDDDDDTFFLGLASMDEWAEFWDVNAEALTAEIGTEAACMGLARNCSLFVGGGAAPLFRVGFVA